MSAVLEPIAPNGIEEHDPLIAGRIVLHLPKDLWSDEEFLALCRANEPLQLEIDGNGDLVIMPPSDTEIGFDTMDIGTDLNNWNRLTKSGRVGDSSTGFRLANGAIRAPDVSWVTKERWKALPIEQRKPFAQIAPDFVLEVMSPSDRRSETQAKMREYIENGVLLGWLIDPLRKEVEIYEPGKDAVTLQKPKTLAGDPVLEGFTLDLSEIWK